MLSAPVYTLLFPKTEYAFVSREHCQQAFVGFRNDVFGWPARYNNLHQSASITTYNRL